jgi:hypothetical protein
MKCKFFSIFSKTFAVLFFSLFFFASCSDTTPHISSLHKTLIYEFNSVEEKAQIKLSVFINPSQDIRRSKSIEILHPESNFVWKIENPKIIENNKKSYFGHSSLTVPSNFNFPEGLFELKYFDIADRDITEKFEINLLKSMADTKDGFVKSSDVLSRKAGTECSKKNIILQDAVGKEIYFGIYSSIIDTDEKILKLFPDAETKRIYFSNQNNSVVILLPQETLKKNK